MVIVQIGSADSSGTEPGYHLAILWQRRFWPTLNFKLFGSVDYTSDHNVGDTVLEGVPCSSEVKCVRNSSSFDQQYSPLDESQALQSSVSDFLLNWL
jgi:hypothetical protein